MKSPHAALNDAVAIQFELRPGDLEEAKVITLGYPCAGWNFLVREGVMAEVLPLPKINPVPKAPSYCWGICNIRGNIIPVFDLSEKISGQSDFKPRDTFYILLQGKPPKQIGIVINRIPKSMQFEPGQLMAQSAYLPEGLNDYVKNIYRQDEEVWHELDVEGLLRAV